MLRPYENAPAPEAGAEVFPAADRAGADCACCKHHKGHVNCAQVDCLRCDAEGCWQCPGCGTDGHTPDDVSEFAGTEVCITCARDAKFAACDEADDAAENDVCRGCGRTVDGCAGECDDCFGEGR